MLYIGGLGAITIDGRKELLSNQDGYYIGMGTQKVVFTLEDRDHPLKFYVVLTPAHKTYPNKKRCLLTALLKPMGDVQHLYKRTIYKYIDAR